MITLKSQLVEKLALKDPERAQTEAREIQRTSRAALRQVRELVSDMRTITIVEELTEAAEILRIAGIELEVHGDVSMENIPDLTQNIVSLCVKEAVTNVVKHSRATYCRVTLLKSEANIQVSIEDNGIGLHPSAITDFNTGNGLKGMTERLSLINGSLTISPAYSGGTHLLVVVPLIITERKDGPTT
ncbi:Sensor histidine kinase DesK [compost metagenome]